jgi:Type I restriction enzyme R protein N terminus (HSDR_N)
MALKIEDLLQHKALSPLPQEDIPTLEKIQDLNIDGYNEAEVRAYVIDPIVKILGYEKGTTFSPDLEKRVDFIDSRKYIDYKCTLWEENFWIIEAKKPEAGRKRTTFEYTVLRQALEYAVHPQINAALVVLCDGDLFEVFDREENVKEPILRFNRSDLAQRFDDLRVLLSPWQVWFFEKRRITRLIDKVFDHEFNLQRLAEFRQMVETQLHGKRAVVLSNYQKTFDAMQNHREQMELLRSMPTDDIVDGWFFLTLPVGHIFAMIHALVDRCLENPFPVLYKLFPDRPRDASDTYYAYGLAFLAVLHKKAENANFTTPWLPAWLKESGSSEISLQAAVQMLMMRCLTQFREDQPRKLTLLCYAAVRRILKRLAVLQESEWVSAEQRFAFMRFFTEEISWNAFASSPSGFVLQSINSRSITISSRLMASFKNEDGTLQVETGKAKLRELWALDAQLIQRAPPNYVALVQERSLGETYPSESIDVTIDYLGHLSLSLLESLPDWKAYALEHHRNDVATLAHLGSRLATNWLEPDLPAIVLTEQELADRFFFGDIGAQRSLTVGAF